MRSTMRGFTLIELMITVVVIAILASIAIPSYRTYVQRSTRTEATSALLRIQAQQEKQFLQWNQYATRIDTAAPAGLNMNATTDGGHYDLAVAAAPNAGYTATATPIASQASDTKCTSFTIDQAGVRQATGSAANPTTECWR